MKLLLVEDDERIVEFLVRGLTAEGCLLDVARDGSTGYRKATDGDYDAIVLDLMMPGMDGREVCQKLRYDGIKTKILMLTALETTADVVQGLRMGADDYLTKPFAFDELVARLTVMGRESGGSSSLPGYRLRVGELEFDTDALDVTYYGQSIELTSLEYALLEFLMTESGKVVSRARILQNVWGAHEDPLTNVVDVYIRRLRSKLSAIDDGEVIKTIRGRGYRL
ncbi:MAG: response regulator [Boseongicola sp.]|nr:MAG: response regulator [Boseongicola sp.]